LLGLATSAARKVLGAAFGDGRGAALARSEQEMWLASFSLLYGWFTEGFDTRI
jgi:hypothetical protein